MEVMLHKKIVVDRVERLCTIQIAGLIINIHLCLMLESELEVKGIVLLLNALWSRVSREHRVQMINFAIRQSRELFGRVPITFSESRVDGEVGTPEGYVLVMPFSTDSFSSFPIVYVKDVGLKVFGSVLIPRGLVS